MAYAEKFSEKTQILLHIRSMNCSVLFVVKFGPYPRIPNFGPKNLSFQSHLLASNGKITFYSRFKYRLGMY